MNEDDKIYYCGREAKLLHKISEDESFIEILSHHLNFVESYDPWDPPHSEPEFTTIIANNKYLSKNPNNLEDAYRKRLAEQDKKYKEREDALAEDLHEIRKEVEKEEKALEEFKKKYAGVYGIGNMVKIITGEYKWLVKFNSYHGIQIVNVASLGEEFSIESLQVRSDSVNGGDEIRTILHDNDLRSEYVAYGFETEDEAYDFTYERLKSRTNRSSSSDIESYKALLEMGYPQIPEWDEDIVKRAKNSIEYAESDIKETQDRIKACLEEIEQNKKDIEKHGCKEETKENDEEPRTYISWCAYRCYAQCGSPLLKDHGH
jgi:flagellar motility protein MotE (MotC chaperone)